MEVFGGTGDFSAPIPETRKPKLVSYRCHEKMSRSAVWSTSDSGVMENAAAATAAAGPAWCAGKGRTVTPGVWPREEEGMGTSTCMDIPRGGVVGWSRASRNLLVPDHGERMSGRNESDSRVLGGGACLASRLSGDSNAGLCSEPQQGAHEEGCRSRVAAVN